MVREGRVARCGLLLLLVLGAVMLYAPLAAAAGGWYTIDDIAQEPYGAFTGGVNGPSYTGGYGFGINASGAVAGTMGADNSTRRAFLWQGPGALTDLGTLNRGAGIAGATSVTTAGAAVGTANARSNSHAFKWSNGTMSDLGALSSKGYSLANDVTATGSIVVGGSSTTAGPEHAFKYDGAMHDLGIPAGGYTITEALGVNASGTIVGMARGSSLMRGFVYSGSTMTLIPTLGGSFGYANHINDAGMIVGTAQTAGGQYHAFSYSNGVITDLTPGAASAEAFGINNLGDVVGEADGRAFLYSGGRLYDLSSLVEPALGWSLVTAFAINDSGQIVVTGTLNGVRRVGRLSLTSQGSNSFLLAKYEPEWRYSTTEPYRPTSAALAVEMVSSAPTYHENVLRLGPLSSMGGTLANADPNDTSHPKLTLDLLTSAYDQDVIDENNDFSGLAPSQVAESDYQAMLSAHPGIYNDVVYGRVVPSGTETYLQYWVYYYFNQKTVDGIGEHEGDWEMVTFHLDSATQGPESVAYAQHNSGEDCAWGLNTTAGQHTVVWVADGSHASYFLPGQHAIWADDAGGGTIQVGTDQTASSTSYIADTPAIVDVSSAPNWITWNGWWGSSDGIFIGGLDKSPMSPGVQGNWDPVAFEGHTNECGFEGSGSGAPAPGALRRLTRSTHRMRTHRELAATQARRHPSLPLKVNARVVNSKIVVNYCFNSTAGTIHTRPWSIFSTVDNPRDRLTVMTARWPVRARCGAYRQTTYPFKPPYTLSIYVASPFGDRSSSLRVPLR